MPWTVYNSDGQILQGSSTLADDAVTTAKILDDAVTYAKMQNLATADRVLGSTSTGVIGEVQIVPDMLATDAVTNVKVATGIDAVKLADGSVTNAELQYINSLSSNAQTQLAAKQATIDASARLDAASIGANGNVSNTEYGYLSGVTSDIQTQINAAGADQAVASEIIGSSGVGSNVDKYIPPDLLFNHPAVAKAVANISATGALSTNTSVNISGVVDNDNGDSITSFSVAFATQDYAVVQGELAGSNSIVRNAQGYSWAVGNWRTIVTVEAGNGEDYLASLVAYGAQ